MLIDHRENFRSSEHAKPWNNISASTSYIEAANAAMLIFASQCPGAEAMKGAQAFLHILSTLTDSRPNKPPLTAANLTHTV